MEFSLNIEKLLNCDKDGFALITPEMISKWKKDEEDPVEVLVTLLGQMSASVSLQS